jgi:hypothetical protein
MTRDKSSWRLIKTKLVSYINQDYEQKSNEITKSRMLNVHRTASTASMQKGIARCPGVSQHCSVTTASCSSYKHSSRLDGATGLAVVDLVAPLAALVGPGEVGDGNDEEGVAGVCDTGKGVVPIGLIS